MTLAQLVSDVSYKANGKVNSFATGTTKWLKITAIANQYIRQWANEFGVDWTSLYTPELSFGVVTNTDSFAVPATVKKISDRPGDIVRIKHTGGVQYTDYDVVPHDDLKMYYSGQNKEYPYGFYCAQIGSNLVFNHKFISTDPQFGGTIYAPVYTAPTELAADSDVVPVTDPMWLVLMVAAELNRTDITRQGQYPNLINEANTLMQRMKENNDGQDDQIYMPWSPTSRRGSNAAFYPKGSNGNV